MLFRSILLLLLLLLLLPRERFRANELVLGRLAQHGGRVQRCHSQRASGLLGKVGGKSNRGGEQPQTSSGAKSNAAAKLDGMPEG